MRILSRKIRVRTAILIALALMLTLSLFFVITFFSIRGSLISRSEEEARGQLTSVLSELRPSIDSATIGQIVSRHAVTGESRLVYLIFERSHDSIKSVYPPSKNFDSSAIPSRVIRQMISLPGRTIFFSVNGSDFHIYSLASGPYIAGVAMNMVFIEEAEDSMVHSFAYSLIFGLFIASACGFLVASFTLAPLASLVSAARSITHGATDGPNRLPEPANVAEIGELASAINSLLEARDASLEQMRSFTADAAHELRTPLTVLKGEIEVELRVLEEHNPQREILESNLEEVERLISIVQDLLYLATMESEAAERDLESECDISICVQRAKERLAALATEKQVEIRANVSELIIYASEERLVRLIYNLVLNAIQHSRPSGLVECSLAEADSAGYLFKIADHGTGIPSEALGHIFNRFYRAGTSRSRKEGGAGLGLAIVQSIADRYGLKLSIESEVNVGTTVSLFIPANLVKDTSNNPEPGFPRSLE
jgi:signal transduction histidine kinase